MTRRTVHSTAPALFLAVALAAQLHAQTYLPGPHPDWQRRAPAELGFDPARLQAAVDFSVASEATSPRDLGLQHQMSFGREPHGEPVGPFKVRGPQTGLIVRNGYIVAEWGEPARVDMTFSVTKTFLSTTVGLAYDRGLIHDVGDLVRDYMPPVVLAAGDGEPGDQATRGPKLLFESEHNRHITWDHLLRQTSDWEGTLWGKPEWADRPDRDPSTWLTRPRVGPGDEFEYNDTRVNLLGLAATMVWRRPLPEVLHEHVMAPIGASSTWQWHGYDNSWINVNGRMVQSVSGGGHWGGGMFINAYDMARLGLLALHDGEWDGQRILSSAWIGMATTPGDANAGYGYMNWYLNQDGRSMPSAPRSAFTFRGAGSNIVYVDRENDLVVVTRWIQGGAFDDFIGRVLGSLEGAVAAGR